jgi:hypothetical protein
VSRQPINLSKATALVITRWISSGLCPIAVFLKNTRARMNISSHCISFLSSSKLSQLDTSEREIFGSVFVGKHALPCFYFCRCLLTSLNSSYVSNELISFLFTQNSNTEYLPTKCRITKPPPPKPATNPLQFVKVAPCPLFQKAHEQIKKVEEIKKERKEVREEPEDWQQVSRIRLIISNLTDTGGTRRILTIGRVVGENAKNIS